MPTKLVFKKKDETYGSLRFKSRNVTLGFMMAPGVDFTKRFSPVDTDASLKTQVDINPKKCKDDWRTQNCDVESSFLEPTIDKIMLIEQNPVMVERVFTTEERHYELAMLLKKLMHENVDTMIKLCKWSMKYLCDDMKITHTQAYPCFP